MASEELFVEDLEIGDDIGPEEMVITSERVRNFIGYRFRGRPHMDRFVDDSAAREEGLPAAVLPAQLIMALLSKFLTDWSPSVTLKKLDVVFRQWVLHNAPVQFKGIITNKNMDSSEPEVECDVFIQRSNGDRLVAGKAVVSLPLRSQ